MANLTFKANLLPNSNLGYSLGSSDYKWKINGVDDPKLSDTTYSAGTALSLSGTTFNVTTVPIANGGTGATTAQNAAWNILRVADTGDLNTAKRLGMFKISNTTTNTPISTMWGATWNIVDDSAGGNTGTNGSTWQLVFKSNDNNMWLRCITNASSWTDYAKFLTDKNYTDSTVTKTGSGASGTWGISITGNAATATKLATTRTISLTGSITGSGNFDGSGNLSITTTTNHTHNYIVSRGNVTCETGTTKPAVAGLSMQNVYNNGYPVTYGNVMTMKGAGAGQLLIGWAGNSTSTTGVRANAYLRSQRDSADMAWSAWYTILDSGNYNDYAPTKTGGGASGTWGISISGTAANADTVDSCHASDFVRAYGTTNANIDSDYGQSIKTFDPIPSGTPPEQNPNITLLSLGNAWGRRKELAFPYSVNNIWYRRRVDNSFSSWVHVWVQGNSITGAVWNDYAEYREVDTLEPGRCVIENGDDTMSLSTKRLQKGCSITSDTWGFAQGETEKAKTPIAVAGRVLAYPYEDRKEFCQHIGDAVCSGPNGTVSIMTDEEVQRYPLAVIGTISAIPDYEEWGESEIADRPPVKVDGRIWIRIR